MSYQGNIRSRLQLKNILRLPAVPFFLLILLSAFSLFYNLRYGSLAAWDEAIFGEVAREIVIEGKGWLTLHFNDHPWFHKPPLFIWLIAIAYKIIGVNEFAVRVGPLYLGLVSLSCFIFWQRNYFYLNGSPFFRL